MLIGEERKSRTSVVHGTKIVVVVIMTLRMVALNKGVKDGTGIVDKLLLLLFITLSMDGDWLSDVFRQ